MGFDPSCDLVVAELGTIEDQSSRLVVDIRSYDRNSPKVQIARQCLTRSGWKFTQLGRLSLPEAKAVGRLLAGVDLGAAARGRLSSPPRSAGYLSPRGDTPPPPTDDDYVGEPEPIDPLAFESQSIQ